MGTRDVSQAKNRFFLIFYLKKKFKLFFFSMGKRRTLELVIYVYLILISL